MTVLFALAALDGVQEPNSNLVVESPIAKLDASSLPNEMRLSPDGKRLLQVIERDDGYYVSVNGLVSKGYEGVVKDSVRFSADGSRYCYSAKLKSGKFVVVVDGKEYPSFDGCAEGMPIFSPDSKRFAYAAQRIGKQCMVLDGEVGPDFDRIGKGLPLFSPDSKHFAYIAKDGEFGVAVLDGKAGTKFRNVAAMCFSPDSEHFAYIGMSATQMVLILDGRELFSDERFIRDSLAFEGANSLRVLSLRNDDILRVRIDLRK